MAQFKLYHTKSAEPEYVAARFWSKVDKSDGCWEWTGSRQGPGYGLFRLNGRLHKAHRVALMLSGVEVPEHLCVLHSCDNPPCCNPAHLRLGTKGENNTERHTKGRSVLPPIRRGEDSHAAKLTSETVRAMRLWRAEGLTYAKIGEKANINPRHAYDVVNGRYWDRI